MVLEVRKWWFWGEMEVQQWGGGMLAMLSTLALVGSLCEDRSSRTIIILYFLCLCYTSTNTVFG